MMTTLITLAALILLGDVPAGFTETTLATGLQRPVALAVLPDGRLLVGEQYTGVVKVYKNGALLPTPFTVLSPVYTGHNESGLLGIAVDPEFETNGYVYFFVTQTAAVQRIWRYTELGDQGIDPTLIVDNLPTTGLNHNGGGITFGPSGFLYVAVGESGNLPNEAQDTSSLRGKILRFHADGSIPADNPFGNAVWSYGHRHPFRMAFRPLNGALVATENGPSVDDEINLIVKGANYGWPLDTGPNADPSHRDPLWNLSTVAAITDIEFYAGSTLPYAGFLFFVEYKNRKIRYLELDASDAAVSGPSDFVTDAGRPVDIAFGPDGALYYTDHNGGLFRVQADGAGNVAPSASLAVSVVAGAPPLVVDVDASASVDPDGTIDSYSWEWGDGSAAGSGMLDSHTYATEGVFRIQLTVTDDGGATGTTSQFVVVSSGGNVTPSSHIEKAEPDSGPAPLTVAFEGHGHDEIDILQHHWDFGDGSDPVVFADVEPDINSALSHTFEKDGAYEVVLTITDLFGLAVTHAVTITVGDGTAEVGADGAESSEDGGGGRCGLIGLEAFLIWGLVILLRRRL